MNKNIKYLAIVVFVGIIAWHQTLGFWFFKAYEATWLMSVLPHTIVNLIRGHSFLYFLDLKLFGWNPAGWYATAILLHLLAGSALYFLIKKLTKNATIAFIASLLFIANSSYIDVIAWGSFNSYYPLLLLFMLLAVYLFNQFLIKRNLLLYIGTVLFVTLGFFVRETGLVIVPLITIFDIIFSKNLKSRKTLIEIIKRQAPFYVLIIIFFFIRSLYGGTPGDSADSLVKWRTRLIDDGLYLELFWAMILTSGKLLAPQLIPYPFLNFSREAIGKFLPLQIVNIYFFPLIGLFLYGILSGITYRIRKNKQLFFVMTFFLMWVAAFSLFVSLAVPNDSASLLVNYEWIPMRYRYFAFAGMSVMYSIILYLFFEKFKHKIKNAEKVAKIIIFGAVVCNIVILWKLEQEIYAKAFKPSKDFYLQLKREFPSFPKNPTFYLYPHTSGLNDYMLEWYFIEGKKYYAKPYQIESQMQAIISKVKKGETNLDTTFFLDYSPTAGLINKAKEVREEIFKPTIYLLPIKKTIDNGSVVFATDTFNGPPVELPVDLKLNLDSSVTAQAGANPNSGKFRMLADYTVERKKYLDTVKIKTTITMSQRENEPFFHVLPSNLIDGNIGPRSSWIVNDAVTWITADLGEIQEVNAVAWGTGENSSRMPASYTLEVSNNGIEWTKRKEVKNNTKAHVIDAFDEPIAVRFVRMNIRTTSKGDFALVDEFEVIGPKGKDVLVFYKDRNLLLYDSLNLFQYMSNQSDLDYAIQNGLNFYWAKLQWDTNLTDPIAHDQFWYFPYPIGKNNIELTIPIRDSEIFAGPGQLLNKKITSIKIYFGDTPFDIKINSAEIAPRY